MKKASKIVLLVAAITGFVFSTIFIPLGFFYTYGATQIKGDEVSMAIAMFIGVTFLLAIIPGFIAAGICLAARSKGTKGLLIAAIILGALGLNTAAILGGIFGLVAYKQEGGLPQREKEISFEGAPVSNDEFVDLP